MDLLGLMNILDKVMYNCIKKKVVYAKSDAVSSKLFSWLIK